MFTAALISVVIYLAIALGLIVSARPVGPLPPEGGLDFSAEVAGTTDRQVSPTAVKAADGVDLVTYLYPNRSGEGPLVVLVHGSGWHGLQFDALAKTLSAQADVVVPDLRGHGFSPKSRGDVSYIGQLEDDLQAIITAYQKPGQKVVLAGHSSGGGLVVRFAGGQHGALLDGAVLMAPFLKYNAPTTRPNSGGWARPLTRRIIGLTMLNAVGLRFLNGLDVIEFRFPEAVRQGPLGASVTDRYSYRLNTSFAPRTDYMSDIKALPEFLLIAGSADEAFFADKYQPLMSEVTAKGRYFVVPEVGHLGIVHTAETSSAILEFLGELQK